MDNRIGEIDIIGSWVEIGMVGVAVVAGIFLALPLIRHVQNKRKPNMWKDPPTSRKFVNTHTKIHEYLTELRVITKSARTQIIQFHNGGYFLDGSAMKRFSLTHESCRSGVSETRSERQDILLTMFAEMLDFVTVNDATPFSVSDLPDCHYRRHLESNNVILFTLIPIRDANGLSVIGCLSIEWCSWVNADTVIDEDVVLVAEEKRRYIEAELATQNT
jgi:hypothetical protein